VAWIPDILLNLIPREIRRVVGIILIIIGLILASLIAILYLIGVTDMGLLGVVIGMMAVLSYTIGLQMRGHKFDYL
tara:strand:+ start:327 stop:554 length:228 start_codon:yes stop_codon:yes gene_type:complete